MAWKLFLYLQKIFVCFNNLNDFNVIQYTLNVYLKQGVHDEHGGEVDHDVCLKMLVLNEAGEEGNGEQTGRGNVDRDQLGAVHKHQWSGRRLHSRAVKINRKPMIYTQDSW